MIFIIASIVASTVFGLFFRLFDTFKVHGLTSIIINYFVACAFGFWFSKDSFEVASYVPQAWFPFACGLGLVFIGSLYVISVTTATIGVSVAQVANKMSMVIPALIAVIAYGNSLTTINSLGIVLALVAVYLVSKKEADATTTPVNSVVKWLFPAIIFLCSGIIDSTINYVQRTVLGTSDTSSFISTIFLTAGIIGIVWLMVLKTQGKLPPLVRNTVLVGIALGLLNFATMYFLVEALNTNVFAPAVLFPVNNVSILILATLCSFAFFKEKLSPLNWLGIALSAVSIAMVSWS
ncbi:MAG: EamA/RhaT family transporter [Bacteroidia bacterium]